MNPFQKNKVDVSALSAEEQKAFRMYGKLPNRKDVLQNKMKERKYFDSGDYALSKAGKTSELSPADVGREHPVPENIPHLSSSPSNSGTLGTIERPGSITASSNSATPQLNTTVSGSGGPGNGGNDTGAGPNAASNNAISPVREGSYLSRETSIDEAGREVTADHRRESNSGLSASISPPPQRQGVPIRGPPTS